MCAWHADHEVFEPVLKLMRRLAESGYAAWLVGGAVRDLILGDPPSDWDIVIATDIKGIQDLFPGIRCVGRGRRMACHTVFQGFRLEITPLKGLTIFSDLGERDFTVNAMAIDPQGRLIDPFGGYNDLKSSVLRFTGSPSERIKDDPLRILRLCRFASSMKLHVPREHLFKAEREGTVLQSVSSQRIGMEILKGLQGRPEAFVALIHSAGLTDFVFPFLQDSPNISFCQEGDISYSLFDHIVRMMTLIQKGNLKRKFALYTLFIPFFSKGKREKMVKKARSIMVQWGWPMDLREETLYYAGYSWLLFHPSLDGPIVYRIYIDSIKLGVNADLVNFADLFLEAIPEKLQPLYVLNLERNKDTLKTAFELLEQDKICISGGEISGIFSIPESPLIGKLHYSLACSISEGKIKTRDEALAFIAKMIGSIRKSYR